MDTECQQRTCDQGVCGVVNAPTGTATATQAAGDCKKSVCDGQGAVTSITDDTDKPIDSKACTDDVCTDGVPSNPGVAQGLPCAEGGGHFCDGAGQCVECVQAADCSSGVCQANVCVAVSCTDGLKNGDETDIDCGGPQCNDCVDGKACTANGDCVSSVCTNSVCQAPSCTDVTKNGAETDVDCGGPACDKCADGKLCSTGNDCSSQVCSGSPSSCQAPSCTDGAKNGGETDVDCGGACAAKCGVGKGCASGADCSGGICSAGACAQINGCDLSNLEDFTGVSTVNIAFGGTLGLVFKPKCIKVSAGTQVTFNGNFVGHPLVGGEVKSGVEIPAQAGTTPLPINPGLNAGTTATFTMAPAGTYPYYCRPHGTFGMNGAIFVVP
jgi:plastocyanin